ncbi:MAG TPA: amidohydrolase family protein [Streptosporangiaceae bacterium]|nr:amidohydrolase family protein [Streptosporangiaceae bacterium]
MKIVDAWMQHPSARFLQEPMFDSLRRWSGGQLASGEIPAELTVAAMDAAGVRLGLLYAECVELGIPFCLQVGHTGPLRSSEPGRPISYLDNVALEFPELIIVGGHIGFPWTAEMISLATKYPIAIRATWSTTCAATAGGRCCSAPTTRPGRRRIA